MILKTLIEEDLTNYKTPSMLLAFPRCSFKCEKDCGERVCHNSSLSQSTNIDVSVDAIIDKYMENSLTKAIVCAGLEPFDSWDDLFDLVIHVRSIGCYDPIVIYTGYNPQEIQSEVNILKAFRNIIIKFGRFIPNDEHHFDEVLGVELASHNQYAIKIS